MLKDPFAAILAPARPAPVARPRPTMVPRPPDDPAALACADMVLAFMTPAPMARATAPAWVPPTAAPITLEVQVKDGRMTAAGFALGDFAMHRPPDGTKGWTVTHIGTGLSAATLRTKAHARLMLDALAAKGVPRCDASTPGEIPRATLKAWGAIVRTVQDTSHTHAA